MRKTEDTGNGWMDVFLICNMCHFRIDLGQTTDELEHLERTRMMIARRVIGELRSYGVVSPQTTRRAEAAEAQRAQLLQSLTETIASHAGDAA